MPAGNSRESRRRKAICSPLGTFEGVCDVRHDRDVQSVSDLMPMPGSLAMVASPLTGISALFLAEVLDLLLRRSEPDDAMSDFLFSSAASLAMLDGRRLTSFHLLFLAKLTQYAGVAPDTSQYRRGMYFDMREGRFTPTMPLHPDAIYPVQAAFIPLLLKMPYHAAHRLHLSRADRNAALDLILRYFSLHVAPLTSLKSLEILRDTGR